MKKAVILLASFVVITSCCRNGEKVDSQNALDILVEKTIDLSLDALERAVEEIKDTSRYPYRCRSDPCTFSFHVHTVIPCTYIKFNTYT